MSKSASSRRQPTPVDDVRRARKHLTLEANGDIAKLAQKAHRTAMQLRRKLQLKMVDLPGPTHRRKRIAG